MATNQYMAAITVDRLVGDESFRELCATVDPTTGAPYRYSDITRQMHARGDSVSEATVARAGKRVREGGGVAPNATTPNTDAPTWSESGDTATIEAPRGRVTSLDELLAIGKVDLSVWEVERHVVNSWEVGTRASDGSVTVTPLFQFKAWLRRIPGVESMREIHAALLADIAAHAPRYDRMPTGKGKAAKVSPRATGAATGYLLEVSPFDLHLAKLAHAEETGDENYDSKIACELLRTAIADALTKAAPFAPDRILFPVGNDLLHIDGPSNQTTAGTPQDADTRYPKMFRRAHQLMVEAIDTLRKVAPVDVLIVPGNHDRTSCFLLGEVLAAWYRHADDVTVDNAPTMRKYYRWGTVLLGLTHGSEEKHDALPLIMANERATDWSETTEHHWHVGHTHAKKQTKYTAANTYGGVVISTLPSLSAADSWHSRMGYVGGARAMESYLWHRDDGYAGHFSYRHLPGRAAA